MGLVLTDVEMPFADGFAVLAAARTVNPRCHVVLLTGRTDPDVGAMVAKAEIASALTPGTHGSTFGGTPFACTAALATLRLVKGGYAENAVVSSFLSAFPINAPRYVVLALLDTPQGNQESQGFVTAGWTVAPTVSRIVTRIGPLLGVAPLEEKNEALRASMALSLDGRRNGNAAF